MSCRSGLQMFAVMTNWKTEFHKPLTRPGVKRDEEMSICSSTLNNWHSLRIDDAKPKNFFGQPGQQTSVGRRMY